MKMLIPSRALASGYPKLPYTVSSRRHLSLTASNRRLENVLIIGAGFMGSGIAQACAIPGTLQSITLQDKSQDQLEKARGHIHANLIKLKEKNKCTYLRSRICSSLIA